MKTRLYLTHEDHGRAMSWEEFAGADTEEGYRYELIEGKVYVASFPSPSHQDYSDWLRWHLDAYANERPEVIGRVRSSPLVFVPNPNVTTFTRPDVACYVEFAKRFDPNADWCDYSPILVIEVLSEEDPDKDLVRNRRLYLQSPSIKEYCILDPRGGIEDLSLLVHRRCGDNWAEGVTIAAGETYSTPILP